LKLQTIYQLFPTNLFFLKGEFFIFQASILVKRDLYWHYLKNNSLIFHDVINEEKKKYTI
jgi:hypothetical protein